LPIATLPCEERGMTDPTSPPLPRLTHPGAADADGHILEAADLWEQYLEPRYQERARCMLLGENVRRCYGLAPHTADVTKTPSTGWHHG